MDTKRNIILAVALVAIVGAIFYLESLHPKHASVAQGDNEVATSTVHTQDFAQKAAVYPMAQELVKPDGYINTQPGFMLSSVVVQKVVLLDFWTYSCINCQRTLPYLEAWYKKYKDYGLEIVGVHTPEFDFEKVLSNVQAAVAKFGVTYPVVLDSEYATWDAYKNNYWPEHYLIDINGLVVDRTIGEGGYAATEAKIQELLAERAKALRLNITVPSGLVDVSAQVIDAQSPETYFGAERNQYLGNGRQGAQGTQTLQKPASMEPNALYLTGSWDFMPQYAETSSAGDRILYTYSAKSVFFVASASSTVDIQVLRDGVPVSAQKGDDVDANGVAHIKEARLYKLIEETDPGQHTLEILIKGAGLQAFTFTFG